ncbi:MAG: hypothetical protein ACK5LL_09365, partial [Suipraeoptans sp.]
DLIQKEKEMHELKTEVNDSGNLAEYSVKINGMMESAQKTAQEYIDLNRSLKEKSQKEAEDILENAENERKRIIGEAREEARRVQRLNINVIQNLREEAGNIIDKIVIEYKKHNSLENENLEDDNRLAM